ncbi:MAG: ATP-binding cassette domain-containing protein [Prevotellaceae bacterium]|jgi:ABC-2 type transport system ATP-binding protein|nr:ATP-binding cassette domain-containing protein [Prevotellaceae bacterium]
MGLLIARDVTKCYAGHVALDRVNIAVPKGTIFGLLGPNGAGKTTLIRIINQITAPDSGEILLSGRPLMADDVYHIGYLPEERGLYKKMKVGEQAIYLSRLKGLSRQDAMQQLKKWFVKFGIEGWWDKKVEELSKGMAQKVQFIVTILHQPQLLIFDEPFSGFDPVNVSLLKEEILALKANGSTIIFSTHSMASVEELCDEIALINKARVVLAGKVDDIRRNYGDNIFEVTFHPATPDAASWLPPEYRIVASKQENGRQKINIQSFAGAEQSANHLLKLLLPHAEITAFRELIPTMNDIFIKVVKNDIQQPL